MQLFISLFPIVQNTESDANTVHTNTENYKTPKLLNLVNKEYAYKQSKFVRLIAKQLYTFKTKIQPAIATLVISCSYSRKASKEAFASLISKRI